MLILTVTTKNCCDIVRLSKSVSIALNREIAQVILFIVGKGITVT